MKKSIFVLAVCLMATAAFATNSWVGPTGSWGDTTLWGSGHMPNGTTDGETKINKIGVISCDLDVAAGNLNTSKITVSGSAAGATTLNIKTNGSLGVGGMLIVGSGNGGGGGPIGQINQTGGTLTLNTSTAVGMLEIGYVSCSTGLGNGTYTISGGTLNGTGAVYVGVGAGTSGLDNPSKTQVGSGTIGKFTVQGTGGTIAVGNLYVGVGDATGVYTGTGTVQFDINGGVSAIGVAGDVYIDPVGQAGAVTSLLVNVTGTLPLGNILLIDNTGVNAIHGQFDLINGIAATEGAQITLGGLAYTLTYVGGTGNDVVLIPEPATIALISIGLLAIRRKK